jgi:hypothetical protein
MALPREEMSNFILKTPYLGTGKNLNRTITDKKEK